MDHRYIDAYSVAQRYLEHTLGPEEQRLFEAHLVGCAECADRMLLARMFEPPPPEIPKRARFVAQFSPWQWLLILVVAGVLLLSIPALWFGAQIRWSPIR